MGRTMADDFAKTLAGHLGVAAVLANVLIDKGIVTRDELCDRFRQAEEAAARSAGGLASAQILAAMLRYLELGNGGPKPQ
jgi:polysaccharide deacetylase 2 family uncharacterized protein YibQ